MPAVNDPVQTKAFDQKTTVLHFIIAHLQRQHPDALDLKQSLPHCEEASKLPSELLAQELNTLYKVRLDTFLKVFRRFPLLLTLLDVGIAREWNVSKP